MAWQTYGIFRARKSGCARASRLRGGSPPVYVHTGRVRVFRMSARGSAGKGATAMIYCPPQILFLRRRELTAFAFIHLFPFHGSPGGAAPPLFRSAPSFKVTDCLLYYPLVSIFTHSSSACSRTSESLRVFLLATRMAPPCTHCSTGRGQFLVRANDARRVHFIRRSNVFYVSRVVE